ncbi:hypothetical protein [Pedobacter soli]|uniref:Mobilization protein n=1 Tax=Pedobacter soli TaxID=390242 RepID=A0A1G6PEZ6_9SPHI|nr:hypothetical protein [Pedobacter soli]SDC78639.1 hypothetical protein SAMN04488024_10331 [Pedobacter soli]
MKKERIIGTIYPRKVMCRLTVDDYQQLKAESLALGLPLSDYFRRLIFDRRAHLVVNAAKLVEWLDKVAVESNFSTDALINYLSVQVRDPNNREHFDKVYTLAGACLTSQQDIEKCIKRLIQLMGK